MVSRVVSRVQSELRFQTKFGARLKAGGEYGTIRAGKRVPISLRLPIVSTEARREIGTALINEVRWIQFRDIDRPDILALEYTQNIRVLRSDLLHLYPYLTEDSWVTFFRFRVADD
jgi:hypothetical protein